MRNVFNRLSHVAQSAVTAVVLCVKVPRARPRRVKQASLVSHQVGQVERLDFVPELLSVPLRKASLALGFLFLQHASRQGVSGVLGGALLFTALCVMGSVL